MAGAVEEKLTLERLLDRAMEEVFGTMIGVACTPLETLPTLEGATVSAMIGLAGAMRGSVVLQSAVGAALQITEMMTGVAATAVDATVRDAVGEMANMVAGAWKGYDPELASRCLLSTPTVVVGNRYEMFSRKAPVRIDRGYAFGQWSCVVAMSCERG